ncbi:mechanosensitive ion channel [Candidatus Poribacteria bacterium]|nr:mechanosensitive ion channel [Candidatus Poribacteria bacterium]
MKRGDMKMESIWNQISQAFQTYAPSILAALVILILGWFFALIIAAIVRGGLRKTGLGRKLADALGDSVQAPGVERKIGKITYYIVMILVLVAFFQVLGLTLVTGPLNSLLNQVFEYLPKVVGAAALLLIAWVVATILRLIINKSLEALKLDERVGSRFGAEEEEKIVPLANTIADAVYWIIFLVFLPSVLGALGLTGLLVPVQGMIDKVLTYLPNILMAAVIIVIGWFLARIIRQIVTKLLSAVGADQLGERIGMSKVLGDQGLSSVTGMVVYVLILIPVLLAALNALQLDAITQPTSNMLNIILSAIPSIFAAAIVLIIAYMIGKVVAGLIANLLSSVGFDRLMAKIGIGGSTEEGKSASAVVGTLVLVAIMLFAAIEAAGMLGFTALVDMASDFMVLAGHVTLGLIIFGIGLYLASLAAKTIRASGTSQANFLAGIARVAILMLVGAIALRQMGLANEIISIAFGLLLGAIAIAVAIAFGVGGRDIAAKKLKEWTEAIEAED